MEFVTYIQRRKPFFMKTRNIIQEKSYAFALKITSFCYEVRREKREYILSRQLLRSGTSVGANIEEAIGGQSPRDFFAKLTISYKEARESFYWLRLLRDSGICANNTTNALVADCEELLRIIGAIQISLRKKEKQAHS